MIESDQYLLGTELQDKSSSKKKLAAFIAGLAIIAATLACFGAYYFSYLKSNETGIHIPMSVHRPTNPHLVFDAHKRRVAKILCKTKSDDKACAESQVDIPVYADDRNIMHIGSIKIGTPHQEFKVLFETEESDLWVPDKTCPNSVCSAHRRYDHTKSSSFNDLGIPFSQQNDYFYVSGIYGLDNIELGSFRLENYQFARVSEVSIDNNFNDYRFDGVLGLGPREMSEDFVPSVLDKLLDSNQIQKRMFAFEFRDFTESSFVTLGGYREKACDGDIMWIDATGASADRYWGFAGDSFGVGNEIMSTDVQFYIDTGFIGIAVDIEIVQQIALKVSGSISVGFLIFNCDEVPSAPDLVITKGDKIIKIPFSKISVEIDETNCSALLVPSDSPRTVILGDPFLMTYYTIYDVDAERFGLAEYSKDPA